MSSVKLQDSVPYPPVHAIIEENPVIGTLFLKDNTAFQGISFGAQHSIAGECVFQTGENLFLLLFFFLILYRGIFE